MTDKKRQSKGEDSGGMAVLSKADRVLAALEMHGELTVKELAEEALESTNSIYRLLSSLLELEWVDYGLKRGSYRLGIGFISLASAAATHLDIRDAVYEPLRELHLDSQETTYLVVRADRLGVCIERFEGAEVLSLAMNLGGSLPLTVGAAPLTLLAFQPAEERERILVSLGLTPVQREDTAEAIVRARARGIVWSDSDVTPGIVACGAPVFNHVSRVVASISVSGRRELLVNRRAEIERSVKTAAIRSSKNLGWSGEWPVRAEMEEPE